MDNTACCNKPAYSRASPQGSNSEVFSQSVDSQGYEGPDYRTCDVGSEKVSSPDVIVDYSGVLEP
jgi:hypothetical protein